MGGSYRNHAGSFSVASRNNNNHKFYPIIIDSVTPAGVRSFNDKCRGKWTNILMSSLLVVVVPESHFLTLAVSPRLSVSLSSAMRSIDVMDDKYFYERESNSFLETLLEFHRSRGTPIPRFPVVAGKKVDLFKLYNTVTELGG